MKITDEMVEAAIVAQQASLRAAHPDPAQAPVWPDDWSESDQAAYRAGMRAALKAVAPLIREECAKIAESNAAIATDDGLDGDAYIALKIVAAIRGAGR
jgi:hypothetical protein